MSAGRRGAPFPALLRSALVARRGRALLAVAAIAIGTSVAAALLLVSRDVGSKVTRELRAYGPNLLVVPNVVNLQHADPGLGLGTVGGEALLGPATLAWLDAELAAGRLVAAAPMRYAVGTRGPTAVVVAGTDLAALIRLNPSWILTDDAGNADAIAGADAARALGLAPGDGATLEIAGGRGTRPLGLARVAVARTGGSEDGQLFVRADRLAEALGGTPDASRFHVALARADGATPAILDYAGHAFPVGSAAVVRESATIRAVRQLSAGDGEVLRRLRLLLVTVTIVSLVAAILCSMSTLTDLVLERTKEIALLRALGAGRRDLVRLFALEAVVLGAVGGLAGLVVGTIAAQAIGLGVFGTTIRIAPLVPPMIVVLGVATALVASVLPLRRALAIEPAPVLRGE